MNTCQIDVKMITMQSCKFYFFNDCHNKENIQELLWQLADIGHKAWPIDSLVDVLYYIVEQYTKRQMKCFI